jgi:hypothetical protein
MEEKRMEEGEEDEQTSRMNLLYYLTTATSPKTAQVTWWGW